MCDCCGISITALSGVYFQWVPRWAPALQPADASHNPAVFKGRQEPQIAWADCLSITGYHTVLAHPCVQPGDGVGVQASSPELARAIAFGTQS